MHTLKRVIKRDIFSQLFGTSISCFVIIMFHFSYGFSYLGTNHRTQVQTICVPPKTAHSVTC